MTVANQPVLILVGRLFPHDFIWNYTKIVGTMEKGILNKVGYKAGPWALHKPFTCIISWLGKLKMKKYSKLLL